MQINSNKRRGKVKIKALRPISCGSKRYDEGAEIAADFAVGHMLVRNGLAEYVNAGDAKNDPGEPTQRCRPSRNRVYSPAEIKRRQSERGAITQVNNPAYRPDA